MQELLLRTVADAIDALRQERRLVPFLAHLLLDKVVRLVGTLAQLRCHAACRSLEAHTREPGGEVPHFFQLISLHVTP